MVSVLYFSHCIFIFGVSFNPRNHPVYDSCIIIIRYLGLTDGFCSDRLPFPLNLRICVQSVH